MDFLGLSIMTILITTPMLSKYDAVSNDVVGMYSLLSGKYDCKVYAEVRNVPDADYISSGGLKKVLNDENSILIYHHSVNWEKGEELLRAAKCKIVFKYHNITPPHFFTKYYEPYVRECTKGREQTDRFIRDYPEALWLCDSKYNASDIEGCNDHREHSPQGCVPMVSICPPFNKTEQWTKIDPDREVLRHCDEDAVNLLFIGRVVPSKGHMFLLDILDSYIRNFSSAVFDSGVKLRMIGNFDPALEYYAEEVKEKIKSCNLEKYVEFIGEINDSQLLAYYMGSDFLVSASEHEGFFVPAIEAQYLGLPIIARAGCAVPETMGENQILLGDDPAQYAAAIHTLCNDNSYREFVRTAGLKNFKRRFSNKIITETFIDFMRTRLGLFGGADAATADVAHTSAAPTDAATRHKTKIALVVQRYGKEINGGAELHAKLIADRFVSMLHCDVEVLTTCALEYTTWENHYPEGVCDVDGIKVRRFKTVKQRNVKKHDRLSTRLFAGGNFSTEQGDNLKLSSKKEFKWLKEQGPYCPALIEYIKQHHSEYDVFVFVTYLYYTTVCGIAEVGDKAILVPTAHDEPPIYMNMYKGVFRSPQGIAFNTAEEREFVQKLFFNKHIPNDLFGVGVDITEDANPAQFCKRYGTSNYLLYAGRMEAGKNLPELFEFFIRYKERNPSDLKLLLMGRGACEPPSHPDIYSLGFVSDRDKTDGMAGARLFVLPSANESLSIVVLESMSHGVPVVVNGRCEVLKGHCEKSGAGLHYSDYDEFESSVKFLLENDTAYAQMREKAREYVNTYYNWDVIMDKYKVMIEDIVGLHSGSSYSS